MPQEISSRLHNTNISSTFRYTRSRDLTSNNNKREWFSSWIVHLHNNNISVVLYSIFAAGAYKFHFTAGWF
jgi:hypothetical protein